MTGTERYFEWKTYPFEKPPEMSGKESSPYPVAIVGGGPVGLAIGLSLARLGIRAVILEAKDRVSDGSRAIAMNRRTLQTLDAIGVGDKILDMGMPWDVSNTFYGTSHVFRLDLHNPPGEKHSPMTNLQQCWVEQILVDEIEQSQFVSIRWLNEVKDVTQTDEEAIVHVETPAGPYEVRASYVVAADGPRSQVRHSLDLEYEGTTFEQRFVITDFYMPSDQFPGRRVWFDPPYSPGSTVLMHRMPFDIWRLDYQLMEHQDAEEESRPEIVHKRIESHLEMIGETGPWELIWISQYRAHALNLREGYRHGRVLFAGDAAHQVPIFGGRGLNHGYADVRNLSWKLARAVRDESSSALLDSFSDERHSDIASTLEELTKVTMYMTTPSDGVDLMREAVLSLSLDVSFVDEIFDPFRGNPFEVRGSALSAYPERDVAFDTGPPCGASLPDFPLFTPNSEEVAHLLNTLKMSQSVLLFISAREQELVGRISSAVGESARVIVITDSAEEVDDSSAVVLTDPSRDIFALFGAGHGTAYVVRPDGYVYARWKQVVVEELVRALALLDKGQGDNSQVGLRD